MHASPVASSLRIVDFLITQNFLAMPPRIPVLRSIRAIDSHPKCSRVAPPVSALCYRLVTRRHITADEKPLPQADGPGPGPNQNQLPHVSEEAAATAKITGEVGPDLDQGTPVQEVCIHNG